MEGLGIVAPGEVDDLRFGESDAGRGETPAGGEVVEVDGRHGQVRLGWKGKGIKVRRNYQHPKAVRKYTIAHQMQ